MHIIVDATNIDTYITGAGVYTYEVLHKIVDNLEHSYTIIIRRSLPSDHPILSLHAEFVYSPNSTFGPIKSLWLGIWLLVYGHRYDTFLSFMPYAPFFTSWCTLPMQFVVHDLKYFLGVANLKTPLHTWYLRSRTITALRRATVLFAVSNTTKDDLLNIIPKKKEEIFVTYAGYQTNILNADVSAPYSEDITPFFLYVGERRPHKNLIQLIDAFLKCKLEYPSVRLVLAGRDYNEYTHILQTHLDTLGIEKSVHIIDQPKAGELRWLYEHAISLVFISQYEGFGIPLLEAMEFGVPIITSNRGVLKEISGKAALLVDITNITSISHAMKEMITNDMLRTKLISAGNEQKKEFSWLKASLIFEKHIV